MHAKPLRIDLLRPRALERGAIGIGLAENPFEMTRIEALHPSRGLTAHSIEISLFLTTSTMRNAA
ncbi:hypothetical protein [Allochromatium palmeri]|uniref:Uncharacterized protein n=1 Tax=Allochromatium palmeri TaxID=231048 RepID=A0A6N8EDS5_9GAMM|nr:hypothetical protein [Allochromatium palmeri]MTW21059.1 hypothetical protein [Allochromatium palmeri]